MSPGVIDTSWERNIRRVSPFLGVILVAVFSLFLIVILRGAISDLTHTVHEEPPSNVSGTLRLTVEQPIYYDSIVQFRSTVRGASKESATYITTACFQSDILVYQRSAQQGVSFYLTDQYERDLEWDGEAASCSATLMYRTVGVNQVDVYILDAVSFEVHARSTTL